MPFLSRRKFNMIHGLSLPYEVADSITLATLVNSYKSMSQQLIDQREGKQWMHPEDIVLYTEKYLPALEVIIGYFGGEDQIRK